MVVKVKEFFEETRQVKNIFYEEKEMQSLISNKYICMNNLYYYTSTNILT